MWPDWRAEDLAALRKRLLRRARRYAPDPAAAEDLAQEALMRVWARLQDDPPVADVERYLFVTLRHLAAGRRQEDEELTEARMPASVPEAADRMTASAVMAALGRLPETQARLIWEHGVEGASFAELARRHRMPLGTVMSRVARGRARLCVRLGVPRERPVEALLEAAE